MSFLIKNGKVFIDGKLIGTDILIEDDTISRIGKIDHAEKILDAKGLIVLPGLIDSHVHCREPGLTHKEDFLTAGIAAAAGGITTILDMPNAKPPTLTVKELEKKRYLAKKCIVNYGFHFGSSGKNLAEIKKAKDIASVKIYLNHTTGDLEIKNKDSVEKIVRNSRLCTVHAENDKVRLITDIAERLKKKVYLCHLSSKKDIAEIRKKRQFVFTEVAPHHLFLTQKDVKKLNEFSFTFPSVKPIERPSLWDALNNNLIDTIGSDHAPHTEKEKLHDKARGVPGLETTVPLLLDAINKKQLTIKKLVQLMSENPAKIFKLKRKGYIKTGYKADFTIVDMKKKKKVLNKELFTKCSWSPFNGKTLKGWPIATIVNGNLIYYKGSIDPMPAKEVQYD